MTKFGRLAPIATVAAVLLIVVMYVLHVRESRSVHSALEAQVSTFMHHIANGYVGRDSPRETTDSPRPGTVNSTAEVNGRDWLGTEDVDALLRMAERDLPAFDAALPDVLQALLRKHVQAFVDDARGWWDVSGQSGFFDRQIPMPLDRFARQLGTEAVLSTAYIYEMAERAAESIMSDYRRAKRSS